EVGLVEERGRREGVVAALLRHPRRGEQAQLVVDEGQQLGGGRRVAGRGGIEYAGDVGHATRVTGDPTGRKECGADPPDCGSSATRRCACSHSGRETSERGT